MNVAKADVITTIAVTDLERAKAFYGDRLGLKRVGSLDMGGNYAETLWQVGGNHFLCTYEKGEPSGSTATACSFEVDDVEATVNDLKKNGIDFEDYDLPGLKTQNGIAKVGDVTSAWFKDPDGNILAVGNSLKVLQEQGQAITR